MLSRETTIGYAGTKTASPVGETEIISNKCFEEISILCLCMKLR